MISILYAALVKHIVLLAMTALYTSPLSLFLSFFGADTWRQGGDPTSNLRGWPDFPQEFVWPRLKDRLPFVGLFHMNDRGTLHLGAPVSRENPASIFLAVGHYSSHLGNRNGLCHSSGSGHRENRNSLCQHKGIPRQTGTACVIIHRPPRQWEQFVSSCSGHMDNRNSLWHHAQVKQKPGTACVITHRSPWQQKQLVSSCTGHTENRNTNSLCHHAPVT